MITPTPRTDAVAEFVYLPGVGPRVQIKAVGIDFARTLEQELDRQYEENVHRIAEQAKAENERDNWCEVSDALAEELALWRKSYPSSAPNSGINLALAAYRKLKEGK